MTSTVQIQKPREEAALASPNLGVQILSVESAIQGISLAISGRGMHVPNASPFDFDVDLSESSRTQDSLNVRYFFNFSKPSLGQVCNINGTAVVKFSQFNPRSDFHTLGNDITNEMAVAIFRNNYEAVYLLLDAMKMDAPTPWITQEVSLSSRNFEVS